MIIECPLGLARRHFGEVYSTDRIRFPAFLHLSCRSGRRVGGGQHCVLPLPSDRESHGGSDPRVFGSLSR
jgi:hypothetical protein